LLLLLSPHEIGPTTTLVVEVLLEDVRGLISRLDKDEARALVLAEGPPYAPIGVGSVHQELEKVKFLEFLGAMDDSAYEALLENMVMCFSRLHLQLEGSHDNLSVERECSSMVEDAPATTEHEH